MAKSMRRARSDQRLDQIPERLGRRPFRYWMDEARRAETPQARVQLFSKALALAPGYRGAWFELGDALRDALDPKVYR